MLLLSLVCIKRCRHPLRESGCCVTMSNVIRIMGGCLNADYFLFSSPFPNALTIEYSFTFMPIHSHSPTEITSFGATMSRQWLLKGWFHLSKHIRNGFLLYTHWSSGLFIFDKKPTIFRHRTWIQNQIHYAKIVYTVFGTIQFPKVL